MLSLVDIGKAIHWPESYDMIYLDPLICSAAWQRSSGTSQQEKAAALLLRKLGLALGDRPADMIGYLDGGGLGTRIKNDRSRQRKVAQALNEIPDDLHKFKDVATLQKDKKTIRNIADQGTLASLIIIDGALAMRTRAPQQIAMAVDEVTMRQGEAQRRVLLMLADYPPPMLTFYDPVIGLMVDEESFWHWTPAFNAMLSPGWYPFSRTLGICSTTAGGQPYIDVLAILVRPYPSLDQVLPLASDDTARRHEPGILENTLRNDLTPAIEAFSTSSGAGASAWNVYQGEKTLLLPPYMFKVCCELNRVDWRGLAARAPEAFQVISTYLTKLGELGACLEARKIDSLIRNQPTDVRTFLREPDEIRGTVYPLSRL